MLFKNQYYNFVAGLPEISFDSMKLPFTVEEFRVILNEVMKAGDKKILNTFFLKYDNDNLLNLLKNKDAILQMTGQLSREEIMTVIDKVKEDLPLPSRQLPPYFGEFIRLWLGDEQHDERKMWDDLLSSLYMNYGMEVKNSLMARWFELNLNIGNILSAIYARKYGMDITKVVVGNNALAAIIREKANIRDFGISQELDYFDLIQRISEEPDIYERERKIDKFRWDWLEENTVFDYFNFEYLFAYLNKLHILERWVSLNAEEGERVFRELIAGLKKGIEMPEDI
jgi:hypothetical protein